MKSITTYVFILLFSIFATGCQGQIMQSKLPADFSFTFHFATGTVPPPYYYSYTLTYSDSVGAKISYCAAYTDSVLFEDMFPVPPDSAAALYALLKEKDLFGEPWLPVKQEAMMVGGSTEYLEVLSGGKEYSIPVQPKKKKEAEEIFSAIKNLIPETIRAEWNDVHDAFQKKNFPNE